MSEHILARKDGIDFVLGYLLAIGGMCPVCGHGTRATSKRWAKCKKCGERVRRRTADEVSEAIREPRQREGRS